MTWRSLVLIGAAASVVMVTIAGVSKAQTQTPPATTPWGDPDLQGVWDRSTITPMERPAALAGKAVFTEAEAAAFEKQVADRLSGGSAQERAEGIQDRAVWFEPGTQVVPDRRTSLIVDPPDGRIPPLTAEGRTRVAARAELREHLERADGPEDRELDDRCIMAPIGQNGPPMTPRSYNNNVQLVQTPGYVVLLNEMIHDTRVVPLDGRSHLAQDLRQWMGDSRGRWDGQTLVVETTNFADRPLISGASPNMQLTERFTRVDATTLRYEFTVNDPAAFTAPFTVVIPMTASPDKKRQVIYEYACHEANYGLMNIFEAARRLEKAGAGSGAKTR